MKRLLASALLLTLVFALLTACGGKTAETEKPEEGDSAYFDCYGSEYKLIQQRSIDERPLGYLASTTFADNALARVKEIESKMNCHINISYDADCYTTITNTSATGMTDIDMTYVESGYTLAKLGMAELLHSYDESDIIDITDRAKYGPLNLAESCMVNGVVYGLIPMKWPNKSYEGNIGSFICFNEGIIKDHNMPNPRELHEKGDWTATNFTDITPEFSIIEGDYITYSLAAHRSNFTRGFLGANGMKMVAEVNGKIVEAFDTKEVLTMLQWASDYVAKNKTYINFLSDYTSFEEFISGFCTMAVIETQWVQDIALKVYDFGILPFPCGPDIEYDTQTTYFSIIDAFAIPELSGEPEACEHILNLLLEPFAGFETEESIKALLNESLFFDKRDTDYYSKLYKNTQAQYYAISGYTFMETIATSFESMTPAELIASLKGTNQENIDDYIGPNYLYIKEQTALEQNK